MERSLLRHTKSLVERIRNGRRQTRALLLRFNEPMQTLVLVDFNRKIGKSAFLYFDIAHCWQNCLMVFSFVSYGVHCFFTFSHLILFGELKQVTDIGRYTLGYVR